MFINNIDTNHRDLKDLALSQLKIKPLAYCLYLFIK